MTNPDPLPGDEDLEDVMSEWIDRSVRQPKQRGLYLTYQAGINEISITSFGTSKGWGNGRYNRRDNIYAVTHWMPLPVPPTGGEQ